MWQSHIPLFSSRALIHSTTFIQKNMYDSIHVGVHVALMRGLSQICLLGTAQHQPSGHETGFLANRNGFGRFLILRSAQCGVRLGSRHARARLRTRIASQPVFLRLTHAQSAKELEIEDHFGFNCVFRFRSCQTVEDRARLWLRHESLFVHHLRLDFGCFSHKVRILQVFVCVEDGCPCSFCRL